MTPRNLAERLEQLAVALQAQGVPAMLAVQGEGGWRVRVTAGADAADLLRQLTDTNPGTEASAPGDADGRTPVDR